jgi:TRAP transporter TAXI family solute receptor
VDLHKVAYLVVPGAALALVLFVLTRLIEPLPPRQITFSSGREGGAYHTFAKEYRRLAAADGFTVDIMPGAGSVETLRRLASGQAMAGFVQGGTAEAAPTDGLLSLGSLYYEPIWLFHRRALAFHGINDLRGRRIQVGEEGSGIRPLAVRLLRDSGVTDKNSTLVALSSEAAASALEGNRIDAAFFIMSPTVPLVRQLLTSPSVSLWSVRRTLAYTTRYRFLSTVTLGEGTADLVNNLPERDVLLLAATATLVVRDDVHPVIVRLLLKTAEVVHSRPGIFEAPNVFPSDAFVELPLHEVARRYLRKGPPLLERYLPFWIAVTVERWVLLVLPLVGLIVPLMRFLPMLYNSRMRGRVTRWYGAVHEIEHVLVGCTPEQARAAAERLRGVQAEVMAMRPPSTSFMGELYHLKIHLEWLLTRADAQAAVPPAAPARAGRRAPSDHVSGA